MNAKEDGAARESVNERRFAEGMERAREMEETAEYAAFVEKFVPKKTTDECYTPALVYEAVRGWAVERYGLQGREIVRPFYPGGDYERAEYPAGCVVIDNPPFSMISKICAFYQKNEILFFLFAQEKTLFSVGSGKHKYVCCDAKITYENGASINTGFVTNLPGAKIVVAADLSKLVNQADAENRAEKTVKNEKYEYPVEVATPTRMADIARRGVSFEIAEGEVQFIRAMDEQRENGKAIYGGGFILSEKAAAEKAAAEAAAEKTAAEKAAAKQWKLSEREREIVRQLGYGGKDEEI